MVRWPRPTAPLMAQDSMQGRGQPCICGNSLSNTNDVGPFPAWRVLKVGVQHQNHGLLLHAEEPFERAMVAGWDIPLALPR